MKPHVKVFRDLASQTCRQRRFPFKEFMEDYGLVDILTYADASDCSPAELAARVLVGCCLEDGQFNNFYVGVLTVVAFLNEQYGRPGGGEEQAFKDLGSILKSSPTSQAIERWVQSYYPS